MRYTPMNHIPKPPVSPIACNECPAGMMQPRLITYFTWMENELVTVPNFPAWICDVCGK
ncbi:MAG: YgiT-type zinc finger protein, partial [Chloroflexi bacterium]|nr:YgiT-type zinc finger protein [Chloroflexota bacterium]